MDETIELLSDRQKKTLFKLLEGATKENVNLDKFLKEQIKYSIVSKNHIEQVYRFRRDNTTKVSVKLQLINLVDNLSTFIDEKLLIIFFGEENNRTMAFTDLNLKILLGIVNKDAPL